MVEQPSLVRPVGVVTQTHAGIFKQMFILSQSVRAAALGRTSAHHPGDYSRLFSVRRFSASSAVQPHSSMTIAILG